MNRSMMLLNDFLNDHRRGEKQDAEFSNRKKRFAEPRFEIRNLPSTVNEQVSEMRKLSAQVQIGNAAAQAIASNYP